MIRRTCLVALMLLGTLAGMGGAATEARAQNNCWAIYGQSSAYTNYEWFPGRWKTQAEAEYNARQACALGSKIIYIGNVCTGNYIPYNCSGPTPPAVIEGYVFWYKQRGQWVQYRGQYINPRPLGACSSSTANQWWRETLSVAAQVNNVYLTQANHWNYARYAKQTWNGSAYKCVGGYVYPK